MIVDKYAELVPQKTHYYSYLGFSFENKNICLEYASSFLVLFLKKTLEIVLVSSSSNDIINMGFFSSCYHEKRDCVHLSLAF